MKSKATRALIWLLISLGVLAEWQLGYAWAGNLAFFTIWMISIISFLALLIPSEDLFKTNSTSRVTRSIFFFALVMMISAGWFLTATATLTAWLSMWVKRTIHWSTMHDNNH